MGALGVVVLWSMLLTPARLQTQEPQGLSTEEPVPTLHMTFDPRRMKLSWDCRENATVESCVMIHTDLGEIEMKPLQKQCNCIFEHFAVHGGLELLIKGNSSRQLFEEKLVYANLGMEDTAAENFSCFIYDRDFLHCTWAKGRAAPVDVQYFLYIRDANGKTETECPHYIEDSGTHVGCRVENVLGLPFNIYFLVNGTSSRGTGIQFFDAILSKIEMQIYSPPVNITVNCNHSHCVLRWECPRTQSHVHPKDLTYELDIQQQGLKEDNSHKPIRIPGDLGNTQNFPVNPRARYTVRIRTAYSRLLQWGPWSEPLEFGFEEGEASPAYVYVLVVLGTLLGALIIGVLFKRFLVVQNLFPPVPGIKDKLNDNQQTNSQVNWGALPPDPEKAEKEEVLTVEEVVA